MRAKGNLTKGKSHPRLLLPLAASEAGKCSRLFQMVIIPARIKSLLRLVAQEHINPYAEKL